MTTFGHQFPNAYYYRALRDAEAGGLEHIYSEFRQPVMRAVSLEGGTSADAAVFFQTALQETARQAMEWNLDDPATEAVLPPFFQQIKALSLTHYRDWLQERNDSLLMPMASPVFPSEENTGAQLEPESGLTEISPPQPADDEVSPVHTDGTEVENGAIEEPDLRTATEEHGTEAERGAIETGDLRTETEEQDLNDFEQDGDTSSAETFDAADREPTLLIPDTETLRATRKKIFSWKKLALLPEKTRAIVLKAIQDNAVEQHPAEMRSFCDVLQWSGDTALPDWALTALQDRKGYNLWQEMQVIEKRISAGLPIIPTPKRIDRTEYVARLVFFGLLLATIAWIFWPRGSKEAKQAYKDVFAPPASIMTDLENRYGADLAFDSLTPRPPYCTELLLAADKVYQRKDYSETLPLLAELYENGDALCQSDALFYMGVVFLQLDAPGKTIACFAKIEDLERYGEDLYWYQALAFVKKAEKDPDDVKVARKALKQAIANTHNEERKEQAQKMLVSLEREVSHE